MIGVLLSALIVFGILKLLPSTKELGGDVAVAAVVAPAVLVFLASAALTAIVVPPIVQLSLLLLYFVVPFVWVRLGLNEPNKVALIVAAAVFVVSIGVTMGLSVAVAGQA